MAMVRVRFLVLIMIFAICGDAARAYPRTPIDNQNLLAGKPFAIALTSRPFALLQGPVNGPVNYVYDELGRLIGAIDASGNAAVYSYDAVGNILSITRYASTQASLLSFSPKQGPVGTPVTLYGIGFSAIPSQNAVEFNGVGATVISASTNQLVVNVPSSALSGSISVTVLAGSATSADAFTVTTSDGKPRIDSFTPQIVSSGTTVNVSGANFDSTPISDRLIVNATSGLFPPTASASSMTLTTPTATGSGRISLSTPNGTTTSAADLFIPPSSYSVAAVGFTGRAASGTPATVTLGTANQIGMLVFDGAKGQMISATAASSTFSGCTYYVYDPTNAQIIDSRAQFHVPANASCATSGGFLDSQPLPFTGTYALVAAPGTSTGHATFTPLCNQDPSWFTSKKLDFISDKILTISSHRSRHRYVWKIRAHQNDSM